VDRDTTVIVLACSDSGPTSSCSPAAPAAARGRAPIWTPTSHTILPIQVIAQQWKFTYRYPTFGGFETRQLVLPDDTTIAFHVTSLDVIHSFWAYQLGVKADANPIPGQRRLHHDRPARLVHRALLRAVRHLARGHVQLRAGRDPTAVLRPGPKSPNQVGGQHQAAAALLLDLHPDANGADGGLYPDNVDPYSKVETYGATPAKGSRPGRRHSCVSAGFTRSVATSKRETSTWPLTSNRCEAPDFPGGGRRHPPARRSERRSRNGCARTSWGDRRRRAGYLPSGTGSATSSPAATPTSRAAGRTTWPSCSACRFGVVGWMAGIGALNYPLAKLIGREPLPPAARAELGALLPHSPTTTRWSGMQYLVGVLTVPSSPAACLAMAIRTELLTPDQPRLRARHLHRSSSASTARS
jgi:hypothetical protein